VATQTTAVPIAPTSSGIVLPRLHTWWRELVRFYYRQRSAWWRDRVPAGFLARDWLWLRNHRFVPATLPVSSITSTISIPAAALIMIVLFTSIFTMMSVIEDRKEGFLLSVLVAPVPRSPSCSGKSWGHKPWPPPKDSSSWSSLR